MSKKFNRILATLLIMTLVITANSFSVLAAEMSPKAELTANNTVTFSNLDCLEVNETMEFNVTDSEGNPAKIGIQRMPEITRASGTEWKVWYTSGVITAQFYMTVSDNKVTSVYDEWIVVVGGTFSDDSLTKTSTYGKLSFTVDSLYGIASFKCWLKGTVTGNNNEIDVTWQM